MRIEQTGLILEGGGMRGIYTAGVLDCLLDEEIYFDNIYAVSAGACHACSYRSRQKGRALHSVVDFLHDKHYCGAYCLVTSGDFFGVKMVYDEIPNRLLPFDYDAYKAADGALWAVATNCRTGAAEYLPVADARSDMDAVRASSSLPMLSRMVEIRGERYLDGGVADSIPLARSIADGHGKNLVVLTQHRGYRKGPNRFAPLAKAMYRRYPALADSIRDRHLGYNEALELVAREEMAGRALVVRPRQPVAIGRLEKDRDKLVQLHREGYRDMEQMLPALRSFLEVTQSRQSG